jgi:hypothetical protein
MGQGNMLQTSLGTSANGPAKRRGDDLTLIDLDSDKRGGAVSKKNTNRERINMKYSPLVERYLMSHKYETMNNVREWKMLLTKHRQGGVTPGSQSDSDQKFERYKKIAEAAVDEMKKLSRVYETKCQQIAEKVRMNEKAAARHIQALQLAKKHKMDGGDHPEYSNMLVSMFNSNQVTNMGDGQN